MVFPNFTPASGHRRRHHAAGPLTVDHTAVETLCAVLCNVLAECGFGAWRTRVRPIFGGGYGTRASLRPRVISHGSHLDCWQATCIHPTANSNGRAGEFMRDDTFAIGGEIGCARCERTIWLFLHMAYAIHIVDVDEIIVKTI